MRCICEKSRRSYNSAITGFEAVLIEEENSPPIIVIWLATLKMPTPAIVLIDPRNSAWILL